MALRGRSRWDASSLSFLGTINDAERRRYRDRESVLIHRVTKGSVFVIATPAGTAVNPAIILFK